MTRILVLLSTICVTVLRFAAVAQNLGTAPTPGLNAIDPSIAFQLPPLPDTVTGGLASALSSTQVGIRASMLSLNGASPLDAWSKASNVLAPQPPAPCSAAQMPFSGPTASQLNALLKGGCLSVVVTAPTLTIDEPIEVQRGGIVLDLGKSVLSASAGLPYMLRIDSTSNVWIKGGEFASGTAGILVNSSAQVRIEGVTLHSLTSDGIVITDSSNVVVTGNRIRAVAGAGIVLHHQTSLCTVQYNEIFGNVGPSNFTAGILLTDRDVDLASNPSAIFGPDGYWAIAEPITSRLHPPHDNVVMSNRTIQNASSGIYVDGGIRNTIASNTISGNAKEGLCLDYGATANVVTGNVVSQNGDRWGEPDWVLAADSISAGGRLPDGTAAEKVPGISLDNAMYNIVFGNTVQHNFGGGVKMVRTGYFNLIGLNMMLSNNDGASASFHFFGIEMGAAPGDSSSQDIDYTPSRGNIVFSNSIRGNHYSGIFFDAGSDVNNAVENTILDAQDWALESVAVMANNTVNNLTTLPSRNIGSGIDPSLLTTGQPVLDPQQ